jgi:hypothetical protein
MGCLPHFIASFGILMRSCSQKGLTRCKYNSALIYYLAIIFWVKDAFCFANFLFCLAFPNKRPLLRLDASANGKIVAGVATIIGTTANAVAQLWFMAIYQLKSSLVLAQTPQRVYLQHPLGQSC